MRTVWLLAALGALGYVLLGRLGSSAAAVRASLTAAADFGGLWTVRRVVPHTFADETLGLPRAGEYAPPVPTPGYLVEVTDGARVFEYHCAGQRCRFCPPCSARLSQNVTVPDC